MNSQNLSSLVNDKTLQPIAMRLVFYCALKDGAGQKVLRENTLTDLGITSTILSRAMSRLKERGCVIYSYRGELIHQFKIDHTVNNEGSKIDSDAHGTHTATRALVPSGSYINITTKKNIKKKVEDDDVALILADVYKETNPRWPVQNKEVHDALIDYLRMRVKKKFVCNKRVVKRLLNKLSGTKHNDAVELIEKALNGGWKDFYSLSPEGGNKTWREKLENEYQSAKNDSITEQHENHFPPLESDRGNDDAVGDSVQRTVHNDPNGNVAGI